jgi:GT2 family glycosyltransferase
MHHVPEPRISALFSTFNRRDLLRAALQALEHQTLPRREFEVIVVDDGSSDDTGSLEKEFRGRLEIRWARQENLGLAEGKNHGLRLARAPIALFMDDDDVASPSLLEEHLRIHDAHPEPEVAVLGFTDLAPDVAARPLMHFVTEVGCYLFCYPRLSDGDVLDHTYFWGGRSSCKTAILVGEDGPFDPVFKFGCEDIELGHRLARKGLRVIYNHQARSTMIRAVSVEDFCRRVERQGESNWVFFEKHPVDEVRRWAHLEDLEGQWNRVADRVDRLTAAARGLDAIVDARIRHGVEVEPELVATLHKHYWAAIDARRVRGSWRARQQSLSHREKPAPSTIVEVRSPSLLAEAPAWPTSRAGGPEGLPDVARDRTASRWSRLAEAMPRLHCWEGEWVAGGFDRPLLLAWMDLLRREGLDRPGCRFLETGAGLSTLCFLGTEPAEVVSVLGPDEALADRIRAESIALDLPLGSLRLEVGFSELLLPGIVLDREPFADLALIDGGHGWPTVFVDFFYASYAVRQHGLIAIDDRQLHSVRELVEMLRVQPGFEVVAEPGRMVVFRKTYVQRMLPDFGGQPYILERSNA